MPAHWKRMPDRERYETQIPVFVIADMVFTNEIDFNIPNKKDPKAAPKPNTVFTFFNFEKTWDCQKTYDSTLTSLSLSGDLIEFNKKKPETFLGSLISGDAYTHSNQGMLMYMEQIPFGRFVARFHLTDGVLEISMYGHDYQHPDQQKRQLNHFLRIIASVQIEHGKSCSLH